MKIKLPRKRKKRYIKKHGYGGYAGATIICKILYERTGDIADTKYPEIVFNGRANYCFIGKPPNLH